MANNQAQPSLPVKPENPILKRLPSFKTPRDLKLTQFASQITEPRTKKVFVPNLNVQRRKPNENSEKKNDVVATGRRSEDSVGRGLPGRGRGRGRGRGKREYVQDKGGVFAEGLAPSNKNRSQRSSLLSGSESISSSSSGSRSLIRNKGGGSSKEDDKEEETKVLKELLRDDFVDDPENQHDDTYIPVALPLTKMENLQLDSFKEESSEKPLSHNHLANSIKIKKEPGLIGEGTSRESMAVDTPPVRADDLRPLSTAQLIAKANTTDFIFFQIPNCIPRLKVPETAQARSSKPNPNKEKDKEEEEKEGLRSVPAGRIGTLQILKSGRARLLIGSVVHHLEPATPAAFRQELISVNVNDTAKSGSLLNLGNLTTRMLVTPDWGCLLSSPPP